MSRHPPFLAVPVTAQISESGHFLSADAPIWRLQQLAGGDTEGPVAIPGLAALAATALRTRMRIENPVRAADEDGDVELWVEAVPMQGFVEIIISGWRDVAVQDASFGRGRTVDLEPKTASAEDDIMIDAELRVVRIPAMIAAKLDEAAPGSHLGSLFVVNGDDSGAIPLVDKLIERKEVQGDTVKLVRDGSAYQLYLSPIFGADDAFLGHRGQLLAFNQETSAVQTTPAANDLPMGRQFASVLKQPLSRIVANAETIGNRLHGPLRDNYADYAQDIANAARHLSELVSDMEDLEAIDRPDFTVARDRVELGDIAKRVAGLLALKAADHGISLNLPSETEKVEAIGEFRRVLQILLNLVGNAIRYAPDGSAITIQIEKRADYASVSVADQGQGVPTEDRERVFEKFERLGRSGDGGSGLGLYISRRLARAMKGDLAVESAPEGGALFTLTLPAR